KGSLLRQLYHETAQLLTDTEDGAVTQREQIDGAIADLRTELAEMEPARVDRIIARHYDDYWVRTDAETQVAHAHLLEEVDQTDAKFATTVTSDRFTEITRLICVAPNHPRLLSQLAGCCAAIGANIIGAQISTTRDGLGIDDFLLQRGFDADDDEERRARRLTKTIENVLLGESRLKDLLAGVKAPTTRSRAFAVVPEVIIDNTVSDQFTVIDAAGRDRPGLLYDLTSALSDLNLDINSARITTFGERANDAFYVTDLMSKKIIAPQRKEQIEKRLLAVLKSK
ncbi:MAG: ACT domain-containing protein, partial [Pseudomonadota bacterium]